MLHLEPYTCLRAVLINRKVFLFTVVLLFCLSSRSQGLIGQNEVSSFTRDKYGAGTQNWAIVQDEADRLYIANNEGLLVYNGTNWQLYPVPNKTILRSIGFGPGGRLYAGAQDELGYFAPDKTGRLRFTSLKPLIPARHQTFTDVWQLEVTASGIFFRTDSRIFQVKNDQVTVHPAPSAWLSMHAHLGNTLAHDRDKGLLLFRQQQWQPFIAANQLPEGFFITDLVSYNKDTSLISTTRNGFYLLTQNKLIPFGSNKAGINAQQHFTSLAILNDGHFLAGSYFNGIYRLSRTGELSENISARNGMPNNTVRCLFTGSNHIAWAGLDNGLVFFPVNNAVKQINPAVFNNGAGYDVTMLNGNLYFALSTGLLQLPVQPVADLSTITNEPRTILGGLTWNLSVVQNQLLAGRDDGLYMIRNDQALPVSQKTGYWASRSLGASQPTLAAGNYLGIHFFEMNDNRLTDRGTLKSFTESSRYIETDSGSIWVSHPYRGIYRIRLADTSIRLFTQKDGLPADLENHVFWIHGEIVFATTKGIYQYDAATSRIIKSPKYEALFGDLPLRYLKEDEKGNIWFVQEKMTGVADYSGAEPVIHYIPELKNKILSGFENIFPYNTQNILIGGEKGFFHLNYEKYRTNIKPFNAYVTQIRSTAGNDSVWFGGYVFDSTISRNKVEVPFQLNSLLFSYAASVYAQHSGLEFSYLLEGFDSGWSNWSVNTEKEYTNLPPGDYTFHIKARISPSHTSSVYRFSFTIQPPWYQTFWAYLLYFLVLIASLFLLLRYQAGKYRKKQEARRLADQLKFEEEQRRTVYLHQLELEKNEKEIIRIKNEKLEAEIEHKNAELASTAMNLVQKKEFVLKLKQELEHLYKGGKETIPASELKKIQRVLSDEEKLNDEWEQFTVHFNSVHGDFLNILKNKYPELKPHELKLCAYLRMNLSSKEIAQLMGISLRGVEISRYRLRKKLQIPTEVNLFQFLFDIK